MPTIVDMTIVLVYMLALMGGGALVAGLMWGLGTRITGHTDCRREIAAIKAHLGMED